MDSGGTTFKFIEGGEHPGGFQNTRDGVLKIAAAYAGCNMIDARRFWNPAMNGDRPL